MVLRKLKPCAHLARSKATERASERRKNRSRKVGSLRAPSENPKEKATLAEGGAPPRARFLTRFDIPGAETTARLVPAASAGRPGGNAGAPGARSHVSARRAAALAGS